MLKATRTRLRDIFILRKEITDLKVMIRTLATYPEEVLEELGRMHFAVESLLEKRFADLKIASEMRTRQQAGQLSDLVVNAALYVQAERQGAFKAKEQRHQAYADNPLYGLF